MLTELTHTNVVFNIKIRPGMEYDRAVSTEKGQFVTMNLEFNFS